MYYIVHKNKDGVYLLDKSQQLLLKGSDMQTMIHTWKQIKQDYDRVGNLYLVYAEKDSTEKQLLTVIRHH